MVRMDLSYSKSGGGNKDVAWSEPEHKGSHLSKIPESYEIISQTERVGQSDFISFIQK